MTPDNGIKWKQGKTTLGKTKTMPTSIGKVVTKYLSDHFDKIMEYTTAKLEDDLDKIVDGKKKWDKVLQKFWDEFNPKVVNLIEDSSSANNLNTGRLVGTHPESD